MNSVGCHGSLLKLWELLQSIPAVRDWNYLIACWQRNRIINSSWAQHMMVALRWELFQNFFFAEKTFSALCKKVRIYLAYGEFWTWARFLSGDVLFKRRRKRLEQWEDQQRGKGRNFANPETARVRAENFLSLIFNHAPKCLLTLLDFLFCLFLTV